MNNSKFNRNERQFDAILKVAFKESVIKEMDALPTSKELNAMFPRSEALDKRVMRIINRENAYF